MGDNEWTSYMESLKRANGVVSPLKRFFSRVKVLEDKKADMLYILNSVETIKHTISKIRQGQIITQKEHNQIAEFIKKQWLSTKIVDIWSENPFLDCQYEYIHAHEDSVLISLIHDYPLVVDADTINEDNSEWWLISITKDNMTMFIQIVNDDKGNPSIRYCSDSYDWFVSAKDDPDNKELIELKRSNKAIFVQKKVDAKGIITVQKVADLVGEHNGAFDKDNLAVLYKQNSMFSIIHKSESVDWNLQVKEVLTFKRSSRFDVMFDKYNTFEAESMGVGKVICKKCYNEQWEFIGIDVFKKLRLGGEKKLNNLCRHIDWLTNI